MKFKDIELSTSQVVVSVWRAVLLGGIVGRVVRRVEIVTRIAESESGCRDSDDDKRHKTEDRHHKM